MSHSILTDTPPHSPQDARAEPVSPKKDAGKKIIATKKARVGSGSACHTDGPSYNDKGGDTTHNKAGG